MEYASYLAGEKWSDHPARTHPLLGELARQVNDFISDEARQALVELAPDMIGSTGADLRIDLWIAPPAARTALPVVTDEPHQIMATAVLTCQRLRADLDRCCPGTPLSQESSDALALAPEAATWARRDARNFSISRQAFRRQTAPTTTRYACARHRARLRTQPGLAPARPAGQGNPAQRPNSARSQAEHLIDFALHHKWRAHGRQLTHRGYPDTGDASNSRGPLSRGAPTRS
jgi:hypothetical protein